MVKTKKCVLVGGGFMESQLLFIIPLIHGYCSFKGIEKVIFDFPIPNKVKNNREIKKILCQYEVIELHNKPVFTIKVFCHALFNISFLFYLYFKIKSEGVLKKNSWFNYQIKHSIWDQSIQSSKDGILFPTSLMLLKSTIIVYFAITKIKILVSDKEIDAAFLGHTVYAARAIKAQLEKLGVKIFIHGGETIFLSKGDIKYGDEILDVRKATNLLEQISDLEVIEFWEKRKLGVSLKEEANFSGKSKKNISENYPKNLILLHVFRDSPFFYIDTNRVFADYIDWIIFTFQTLSESKENWIVKLHPSAERWGENQYIFLNKLKKYIFGSSSWPKNLNFISNEYSNMNLFKHCKRIVTYNGSAHLEAACFGIKPIVISKVLLESVRENLVLKPSSIFEYKDFLLTSNEDEIFKLSLLDTKKAQKLLYAYENKLNFAKDIDHKLVHRGDTLNLKYSNYKLIENKMPSFINFFQYQGNYLAKGGSRVVSSEFCEAWGKTIEKN